MKRKTYKNPVLKGADPFVIFYEGKYYLYSTSAPDGYLVYESDNLRDWKRRGYCLKKEDVKGETMFWAPEVMEMGGKFYMIYTADLHLGIAVADHPLGPFRQSEKVWLSDKEAIDGHFFRDEDGSLYLYYVRLADGNQIFGAKMTEDFRLLEESETFLLEAEAPWEVKMGRIAEGPFLLKHGGRYYLTYSANDCRSADYAIGYAVSEHPLGLFKKYEGNPILSKNEKVRGVGHHSFTTSKDGTRLICVYHCHRSARSMQPRMVCVDRAEFITSGDQDILKIHGPSFGKEESIV